MCRSWLMDRVAVMVFGANVTNHGCVANGECAADGLLQPLWSKGPQIEFSKEA